jgi:hypothetical protein
MTGLELGFHQQRLLSGAWCTLAAALPTHNRILLNRMTLKFIRLDQISLKTAPVLNPTASSCMHSSTFNLQLRKYIVQFKL